MDDDLERRLDRIERRLDRIHVLCTVLVCALGLLLVVPVLFVVLAGGVPAVVAVTLLGALVAFVAHGRRAARVADA